MLQASSSGDNNSGPSPAAAFFAALQGGSQPSPQEQPRSLSLGTSNNAADGSQQNGAGADVRRARSMRNPVRNDFPGVSSFTSAGSNLAASPKPMEASDYVAPAAARHPLFSHHAIPPAFPRALSPMSDPGMDTFGMGTDPSAPPSPGGSTVSSGAFSPASAFLSHFSSRSNDTPAPDAQGSRVLDYTLGKVLGRGGFSTVRQAIHVTTGEIFACKIVKRDDLSDSSGSVERFEDEIRVWQSLPQHKYLLPLLEMHRTSYATFLIMPFLPGGSLLEVLKREGGSEKTARTWFPGVVNAVAALHEGFEGFEGGMMHGDLKLDNFIVDHGGLVRLGDFGMAARVNPQAAKNHGTTLSPSTAQRPSGLPQHMHSRGRLSSAPMGSPRIPSRSPNRRRDTLASAEINANINAPPCPSASLPYAPPELLGASPPGPSLAQDIWAVGIILHALLTGRLPFSDSFDPRLQMKILRGQWEEPAHLGHEWLEALHGCMERDLRKRWDIRKVRECDAVTGWREVKPRIKSRSRSRARLPEGGMDPIPIPGRGRDPSKTRFRPGSGQGPHIHHRGGPGFQDERERLHVVTGGEPGSRSRSQSANRRQSPATPRVRAGLQLHDTSRAGPGIAPEGLATQLENVAITRGRSTQRGWPDDRTSSAGSLKVTPEFSGDQREDSRSPSAQRRPLSGSFNPEAPHGGRGRSRPRSGANVPGSAMWWDKEGRETASGTSSGMHSPARTRGSPGHPVGGPEQFIPVQPGSRPPTFGFELDVVDEDAPERGRSPAARGRPPNRSKSRGRDL